MQTLNSIRSGSLLFTLTEICAETAPSEKWSLQPDSSTDPVWIRAAPPMQPAATQGWKLHISATVLSAIQVMLASVPILLRASVPFKIAYSVESLGAINSGVGGLTQIGKFITVYTQTDEQAVELAAALDVATRGLAGPRILSERRLGSGSLVHYRYGSYGGRLLQTTIGEILPALSAPNGDLVADPRGQGSPPWTVDPFAAAALALPEAATRVLAGGRYVITAKIYDSPRGALYVAADTEAGRSCIVKQARRCCGLQANGLDATDSLRAEADVLRKLAPSRYFPALHDEFSEEGDAYLVLEDVGDKTLERILQSARRDARAMSVTLICGWALDVAAAIDAIHRLGLVYSDVKPSNVVFANTAEGQSGFVRLIDFDVTVPIGSNRAGGLQGTRGYASPQHVAGAPASPADDIYGFGALLYAMVTLAEPAAAPDRDNLLTRSLEALRPGIYARLVSVIEKCLTADPSDRFADMSAVISAIDALVSSPVDPSMPALMLTDHSVDRESSLPESANVESSDRTLRISQPIEVNWGAMARRIGDSLCRAAIWQEDGGCVWSSRHPSGFGVYSRDINTGLAGTALALAEIVDVFRDADHIHTLSGAAQALMNGPLVHGRLTGLYVGEGGVAAALLRAGQVLDNDEWTQAAGVIARRQFDAPYGSPDLFHGSAGLLRLALIFYDWTRDWRYLDEAIKLGDRLVELQTGGLWTIPSGFGSLSGAAPLGYAHGAAGIGDALLDLYDVSGAAMYRDTAAGTVQRLVGLSESCLADSSGLAWPPVEGKTLASPFWCHGATGIGQFMLHAAQVGTSNAHAAACCCGRSAAFGARWANPTLCHGLSGNIELLIDLYHATGDADYRDDALDLAALLQTFAVETAAGLNWPSEQPAVVTPDYMVGYAGIAVTLLRLAEMRGRPRQLTRAGFRRPRGG